ncbi:hypothetical protein [Macrococcus carouselicus]|uniref:DUF3800 domain-containing protein n=1 Tax=Macrococcus carouselicus TaxID=69969 RepID=A0A9Q8CAL8_9STAP|nr:hypothetical protein [Macrococcus carouselicus]TDL94372.1 hypothetical protein ERX40_10870 [Macrococcus carouselicus]
MHRDEILFYTYLDECKKNFFTTEFYQNQDNKNKDYNFYSLTSVSFESQEYRNKFEKEWCEFKERFKIPDDTCLHFAEYKKLLSSKHVKNIELAFVQKSAIFSSDTQINLEKLEILLDGDELLNEKEKKSLLDEFHRIKDSEIAMTEKYQKGKELFNRYTKKAWEVDEKDMSGYELFLNSQEQFDIRNVHSFFLELKKILEEASFVILNTDYINLKKPYLANRKNTAPHIPSNANILPAKNLRKAEPRVTMKRHLDILIEFLISRKVDGVSYLDENLPDSVYTKLRFDADGKQFEAKNDLKMAFHECLAIGTDRFSQKTAVKVLDEIRFIRKEEVGSKNNPPHCGSEVVDFLCSLVCSETRVSYLTKIGVISSEDFPPGKYATLVFEEELEEITFKDMIEEKLFLSAIIDYT